ncbi:MAG: hypothetical protein K8T90_03425 [Planctomycetes bacterium]|nr:hypothetical protein [Planctomycetota bacterium]
MKLHLPAAVLLLAVGGALSAKAESLRATPRPPAGVASFLGGFSAVAAQAVWLKADRAVIDRDEDRAIVLLRTLVDLQPQVVSAAKHASDEIGWNMLGGHEDPEIRWSLAHEAHRILSESIDRNPGSADALHNRGHYVAFRIGGEAALEARFTRETDPRGPAAAARSDFERALVIAPADGEIAAALALVAGGIGVSAAREARWDDAADALRSAVRAYAIVLDDARAQLGDEVDRPGAARDSFQATAASGDALSALLDVALADRPSRPSRLADFTREHPEVLR